VNLRGQTVVIFDLGLRLGLQPVLITDESHAIVLKDDRVGLLVDRIGDVVQAEESAIEVTLANRDGMEIPFSKGVLKLKDDLLVILSTEKIMKQEAADQ
jgi:purine-binding chemotaxis protein CheW